MKLSQADIPFDSLDPTRFSTSTLGYIITLALPIVFGVAGFLILFFIISGGFQIMLSRGDPKTMEAGKNKITYAIVGLLVMFAAYWIIQILGTTLSIGQITGASGGIFPR
jgi:hypothetical protein